MKIVKLGYSYILENLRITIKDLEGSHSGLVRLLGEQVYLNWYREFKSHTLRQDNFLSA